MTVPFADIKAAAVPFVRVLVPRWVPRLAARGDWLMGSVPWREDKHPSFGVSVTTGNWKDFGRDEGGDIIDLLARVRGISNVEAAREIARSVGHPFGRGE